MSDMSEIHGKLGVLLERTKDLPELTKIVTRHEERWETLTTKTLPPLQASVDEDKKRKWFAEGARTVAAIIAGFLGGHSA